MAVFVTKIGIATRFFDFHDRCVALKNAKWLVRCGDRRFSSDPAQQRKRHEQKS